MRSSGNAGSPNGSAVDNQEEKSQRNTGGGAGHIKVVGLGPGGEAGLSAQAREALVWADVVVGYKTYVGRMEHLLAGKKLLSSGMTKELDRADLALEKAREGARVALVSGGDPGIYAMAGVMFDLLKAKNISLGDGPDRVKVEVIPGIPALAAAAAILGAPLTHDFAAISLSDRLTPWELIEKRLALAAEADFVITLYNPKSKGRDWQFEAACKIVGRHRGPDTPVGVVTRAMQEGQTMELTTLGQAPEADVTMQALVVIGNSRTYTYQDRMITPRGYLDKYSVPGKSE